MSTRTEEDKVVQASITVILGGVKHNVAPLVIRDSRPWRNEVMKLMASLPQYAKVDTDSPDEFEEAINVIMAEMPDTLIDLFFGYAKDLDRDKIEAVATEKEIAVAFRQVIEIAFPLVESMTKTMEQLAP